VKRRSRARQRGSPKTNEATAARFRRERDEALEQQAAVAEVLRVISSAGEADIFPQDVTRALLNVISNGFYAATKRKAEAGGDDYEPMLAASTKSLGGRVEIRIRDNGTGIPPDVKEKMFDPFFTTKPAGEGTGLGLSISHDIIVKQHGGSIEVDTRPGEFTEISVTLPRAVIAVPEAGKRV
jgi:signal transduction histidine kinase